MRFGLLSFLTFLFFGLQVQAFLTIGESGDMVEANHYRLGLEPQLRISNGSGGNLGIYVDGAINDEWNWRAEMGTGDTDFWFTGSAKWIPIPDFKKQPAIGLRLDASLGRDHNDSFSVFRVAPMVGKGFETEVGRFTPYIAVPVGIWATRGTSDNISHFVIGSEGKFEEAKGYLFSAEMGFNMSKAFSYISGTVSYLF